MARRKWNLKTIEDVVDGNNPFIQIGYTPESSDRKEGESWSDSKGRKFLRKDGRNIRVSSTNTPLLDAINELSKCSKCGLNVKNYGNVLDKKVFPKTQMCYDCLEEEEMVYRVNGQWEEYQHMKILKNHRSALVNFRDKVLESIDFLSKETGKIKETMPDGKELVFSGTSNPQWLEDAKADLIKVDVELEKITKEIETFKTTLTI
jgi:hypothetical protein